MSFFWLFCFHFQKIKNKTSKLKSDSNFEITPSILTGHSCDFFLYDSIIFLKSDSRVSCGCPLGEAYWTAANTAVNFLGVGSVVQYAYFVPYLTPISIILLACIFCFINIVRHFFTICLIKFRWAQ